MSEGKASSGQFRGWLLKWTNYIKGYQRRWFVLSNGLLSYYRTQEEMAHTCRGTINLAGSFIDTMNATDFVITNGPSQVYHLRALNEVERQRWVTALELAKAKAIKNLESDDSDDSGSEEESDNPLATLQDRLKELRTAHELMTKNCNSLMRQVAEAEETSGGEKGGGLLKEKLTLFKLSTAAMMKAADEFLLQAMNTDRRWSRALQHEHSLRLELQESMESLAKQMYGMESKARGMFVVQTPSSSSLVPPEQNSVPVGLIARMIPGGPIGRVEKRRKEGEEEEEEEEKFFDAPEISQEQWEKTHLFPQEGNSSFVPGHKRNVSTASVNEAQALLSVPEPEQLPVCPERTMSLPEGPVPSFFENIKPTLQVRRKTISPKPNHKLNLWTIMKNCIGRDLSKIPMPVNFNEPTSMLQRMVEDFIHADILERGAACQDSLQELAHVGTFAVSCYATTAIPVRVGKPFNPLLGETYECDRRAEYGWRCFMEQVSHHPPMFAMHVEHKDWTLWEEYTVASKFRGKYIVCYPIGSTHIVFHGTGNHYTFTKIVTTVHNIIVGKLWVDQSGEMKITNHVTGDECHLKFQAYSYFSRERQRKVTGTVKDASGQPHWVLSGYWDEEIECAKVISGEGKSAITEPPTTLWTAVEPPPGNELIYGFMEFTCTLNELEEGVAPTDSRLRPDQRLMEDGDFDAANAEKLRLEEKQRAKRRKREAAAVKAAAAAAAGNHEEADELEKESTYSPVWFKKEYDPLTNTMMHVYQGGYWEGKAKGDWGRELPDIF